MPTRSPALGSRLGRSDLTIFHWKIVRVVLTLGFRLGRSALTTVHRTVVRARLIPHSRSTAVNSPSDRDVVPSR